MDEKAVEFRVVHARDMGCAKCTRCWKWRPECGYDLSKGCQILLCNPCVRVLTEHFNDFPAFVEFREERQRVYG